MDPNEHKIECLQNDLRIERTRNNRVHRAFLKWLEVYQKVSPTLTGMRKHTLFEATAELQKAFRGEG
jgi:hypothetical protein